MPFYHRTCRSGLPGLSSPAPFEPKEAAFIARTKHARKIIGAVLLCLASVGAAFPVHGQLLGNWAGSFGNGAGADSFDYPITVAQDGMVSVVTTADSTLISQLNSTRVLDQSGDTIDPASLLMSSPDYLDLPLAAGSYTVRIARAHLNGYGDYAITATLTPATTVATETENNDTIGAADPISSRILRGSVGYFRDKNAQGVEDWDNDDYFSCQVSQDGTLGIAFQFDPALVNFGNAISIRNAGDTSLASAPLSSSPLSITVPNLEAGTYFIRVHGLVGHGAYQITISGDVIVHSGDVNADGSVTLGDAILALKAVSGLDTAGTGLTTDADIDGDGKIGLAEAIVVLQTAAGLR